MPLLERGVVFIVYHTDDHVGVKKKIVVVPTTTTKGGQVQISSIDFVA